MKSWTSTIRIVAVTAVVGATAVVGSVAAQATPATSAGDAMIRAAHFSPTTPGVDVYLGSFSGASSKEWLSGVRYGAVSPYELLSPGLYTVSMRLHGAASTTKPVLSWTLDARSGHAYTVAGVGSGASVRGVVIPDDLSAPPAGEGRVRVIQAASRAPVATVRAQPGPVIALDTAFATTSAYASVPIGTWHVDATSSDATPAVQTSGTVAVAAGQTTSVLLLDAKNSGITLRTVLDSSGVASAPSGSVPAGGGGMATVYINEPHRASSSVAAIGVGALGLIVLLMVGVASRSRRPGHVAATQ
jgi:hypothetical protein